MERDYKPSAPRADARAGWQHAVYGHYIVTSRDPAGDFGFVWFDRSVLWTPAGHQHHNFLGFGVGARCICAAPLLKSDYQHNGDANSRRCKRTESDRRKETPEPRMIFISQFIILARVSQSMSMCTTSCTCSMSRRRRRRLPHVINWRRHSSATLAHTSGVELEAACCCC